MFMLNFYELLDLLFFVLLLLYLKLLDLLLFIKDFVSILDISELVEVTLILKEIVFKVVLVVIKQVRREVKLV